MGCRVVTRLGQTDGQTYRQMVQGTTIPYSPNVLRVKMQSFASQASWRLFIYWALCMFPVTSYHSFNSLRPSTHICVGKLTIIGSDNGLSPGRRQAIIWTIVGILLIGPLGTNFSEILIGIQNFSFKKMHLKMSSAKWRPFVSASMC